MRERDAHAWPEVYFPGYGWIEFEPTGNQDPFERPQERKETPVAAADQANNPLGFEALQQEDPQLPIPLERPQEIISRIQIFQISILASGFMLAFLAIFLKRRYAPNIQTSVILKNMVERGGWETPSWLNKWTGWATLTPIERYFHSVNTSLKWLGKPQALHITAAERADILKKLMPSATSAIETLLGEHQSALFSPRGGSVQVARRAAWKIIYQTITTRLTARRINFYR